MFEEFESCMTKAQKLLKKHSISQREIANASGVKLASVNRALSVKNCGRTQFVNVQLVRIFVEKLLISVGESVPNDLWLEYDADIQQALKTEINGII